jgi:hypothetical protein
MRVHVLRRIQTPSQHWQVCCELREGKAPDDVVAAAKASLENARLGEAITRFLARGLAI